MLVMPLYESTLLCLNNRFREAHDAITLRVGWITDEYNLADLLKKTTMTGNMRHRLVELIL